MLNRVWISTASLLLLAAAAAAQDTPELRWHFAPGARLEIVREVQSHTATTTSIGEEKPTVKEEKEEAKTTFDVSVVSGTDADGYRIECKLREFSFSSGTAAEVLSVAAFRDPRGAPRVRIRTGTDAPLSKEAGTLLEKVAGRLLRCRWHLTVSPRGKILSAEFTGDPFAVLGIGGSHSMIVEGMLRSMNSGSDLAGAFGASLFTRLPGGRPAAGASWTAERELKLAGLSMSGRGVGRLLAPIEGAGQRIEETLALEVDTEALKKRTKRLLDAMFGEMTQPADTEVEIPDVPEVKARIVTTLGNDGVTTTVWDEITVPVAGRLRLDVGGEKSAVEVGNVTKATIRTVIRRR